MGSYSAPAFSGGTVTSLTDTGPLSATTGAFSGALSAPSVTATGTVQGATVTATGTVSGATVSSSGAVTGASVTATAAVQGATVLATSGLGVWGVAAPGARPAAYTIAGPAASRTLSAPTAVAPASTAATNVTPYGFAQAQANAIKDAVINLVADHAALQGVVRQLLADLAAYGITQ